MPIQCPNCRMDFNAEDIAHTLKNGHFQCPVCDAKIPSPSASDRQNDPASFFRRSAPALIVLGIAAACLIFYFFSASLKTAPTTSPVPPAAAIPAPLPASAPTGAPPDIPALPEKTQSAQTAPTPQPLDKMKIVELIAAMYHVTHSYTMDGGFVCLDMAIDVWNQLKTRGIDAKIMGGILTENIATWNYRQLAMDSNHAWVIVTISPTEKVAVETTAGIVIKPGMKDYPAYFKGIAFDSPAEIKRFELIRKAAYGNCRATNQMIKDWNENVAGKPMRPEDAIARQSQLEQRKADCENAFNALKEFESKAIFY